MNINPCKYAGDKVLLVEGADDCHVILALCKHFAIPETFGIYECGSDIEAIKRMNALLASENLPTTIGLVTDADTNLTDRWASISNKLKSKGYVFPTTPHPSGTIIQPDDDKPRIGFWLMPNNQTVGMLEDFCLEMIREDAKQTIEECIQIAESRNHTTFIPAHRSKAIVHTHLAWQDEPGKPLGQSITKQTLLAETDTAKQFAKWLTELFSH